MVVTRSYASKYNVKLYNELDYHKKKNNENDNNYVFLFIYILFYLLMIFLVYSMFTNYYTGNKFNELNKENNFILLDNNFVLLENNLPEKTLEYLSDNLYSRLPAKSYENNYFEEFFYRFISEDRYDYYLHFFN